MKGSWKAIAGVLILGGCDAAQDVDVLPLPPLERPTPEARLGLPEVQGVWRFAGWEILRGDSTTLERTFPSFGELRIDAQRLDSIAGVFALAGGPARVIGDVRRDSTLALVTLTAAGPSGYVAGELARDTLWLELTSVMAPGEWPQDSRAAFVRGEVGEPIAWLRGAGPAQPPVDSLSTLPPAPGQPGIGPGQTGLPGSGALPPQPGAVQPGLGQPGVPGAAQPRQPTTPGAVQPRPAGGPQPQQPPAQQPPAQQPQPQQPQPQQPPPAQQPQQPPVQQPPAQQPEPEPEPEPQPDLPDLLGDPVL